MAPFVIGPSLTMSHIEFAGIFVGKNMVVHFTPDRDLNSSNWISSDSSFYNSRLICSSYPECGFRKPNSGVVRSCLDCFLRNGSLFRYEYGVSQLVFLAHLRGAHAPLQNLTLQQKLSTEHRIFLKVDLAIIICFKTTVKILRFIAKLVF
jgi:hypothetical protein